MSPPIVVPSNNGTAQQSEKAVPATTSPSTGSLQHSLPLHHTHSNPIPVINTNQPRRSLRAWLADLLTVRPTGESYRRGFSPFAFVKIILRSSNLASRVVNILWPFVP